MFLLHFCKHLQQIEGKALLAILPDEIADTALSKSLLTSAGSAPFESTVPVKYTILLAAGVLDVSMPVGVAAPSKEQEVIIEKTKAINKKVNMGCKTDRLLHEFRTGCPPPRYMYSSFKSSHIFTFSYINLFNK
ncbi:MAG: hypothetical protein K5640_00465 [Treponema sp.]|nr:hypothetical protein [Treponema sp.]